MHRQKPFSAFFLLLLSSRERFSCKDAGVENAPLNLWYVPILSWGLRFCQRALIFFLCKQMVSRHLRKTAFYLMFTSTLFTSSFAGVCPSYRPIIPQIHLPTWPFLISPWQRRFLCLYFTCKRFLTFITLAKPSFYVFFFVNKVYKKEEAMPRFILCLLVVFRGPSALW